MRTFQTHFILFIFLLQGIASFSQELHFSAAPENYQLYARDSSNTATVQISGAVNGTPDFKQMTLKVFKDGDLIDEKITALKDKRFSLATKINAGLHQFRFELYLQKKSKDSLYLTVDNVVCGDAYIISGQSNSHASSSESNYSSPFCRSFGVKTGFESYSEEDKKVRWGLATGNLKDLKGIGGWFKKNPFGVGVWGMELMKLLVEKHQVPVCIINGGSGSSSIEQNMLYPEKPSLDTSFGRLAYRVDQAGLKDKVKAIMWHQGESNANTQESYGGYASNFDILLKDWKSLYTGLEKVYLFQLHPGCGRTSEGYNAEMREVQNQLAEKYKMVDIMSTIGVPGHDGCHFSHEGYLAFARQLFPLVSRDFYGESANYSITPPKLLNATYDNPKQLRLTFDQPVFLEEKREVNGKVHYLKDQFFLSEKLGATNIPAIVKSIKSDQNTLVLSMDKASNYKFITYLPSKFYADTNEIYNGPWLFGSENKIGALSFHQRPIANPSDLLQNSQSLWHGYTMLNGTRNGVNYKVVFPKKENKNRDWIWRARFWGHEPQTDIALLEQGFHVAYIEVGGLFGNEKAIKIWDDFYAFITDTYNLNSKVVLEGKSRGGLIIFNWGNRNAEKVACIYADAPVCDFKSWPAGKGSGKGSEQAWAECLTQYGFSEDVALQFNGNPISHMENLASYKVPILAVVGDADDVVPVSENIALVQKRLVSLGWDLDIIHKPKVGHHPHSLKDPKPIVDFILKYTTN
ncbi:prolyl oligopeptidase family serine peptidase [Cellulophaga sp. F20128]|uniref:sialate O-acetylesterase n=1 Tax=Cellulophaga sp. F20128 TaxID=2926413 RepID=UPI001FF58F7E|nr:sialate O-acetylesterase [Cellulophaga sp. F20128]MCK0157283.1 prolyl oligopeptidase family serine peptidase [Cellulophaga sp. F20128]